MPKGDSCVRTSDIPLIATYKPRTSSAIHKVIQTFRYAAPRLQIELKSTTTLLTEESAKLS